jgi:hypothetical protein
VLARPAEPFVRRGTTTPLSLFPDQLFSVHPTPTRPYTPTRVPPLQVHYILDEIVQGGMVVETSLPDIHSAMTEGNVLAAAR